MARVRVGYSGRDLAGRLTGPVTRDLGPAAAAVDGLDAMGRLSATVAQEYLEADVSVAMGSGPIVTRQATAADLARLTPPPTARPVRPGPAMYLMRPAKPAALPVTPSPLEEEPVTVTATIAPEGAGLPPLPCASCSHAPVCRLQPKVAEAMYAIGLVATAGDPGVRIRSTVECDHYLAAAPAPLAQVTPLRVAQTAAELQASRRRGTERMLEEKAKAGTIRVREASIDGLAARHPSKKGEAAEKAERAAAVLAAVERHDGDRRAAAAELGMRPNALAMVLKFASARAPLAEPEAVSA